MQDPEMGRLTICGSVYSTCAEYAVRSWVVSWDKTQMAGWYSETEVKRRSPSGLGYGEMDLPDQRSGRLVGMQGILAEREDIP